MIAAAVAGAGPGCGVLAVTVLPSFDGQGLASVLGRPVGSVSDEVSRLAVIARRAGAHGVVCSGHEAARIRSEHGDALAVLVPGVRLPGGATHDQSRVVTPGEAAAVGATYLVIGRTVTAAPTPLAAMMEVLRDINRASGGAVVLA